MSRKKRVSASSIAFIVVGLLVKLFAAMAGSILGAALGWSLSLLGVLFAYSDMKDDEEEPKKPVARSG